MSGTRTLRNPLVSPGSVGVLRLTPGLSSVGPPPVLRVSHVLATFMMTGVALQQHLPAQQRPVELPGTVLIGDNEEMGDDEAFLRCGKVGWVHVIPPLARIRTGGFIVLSYGASARAVMRVSCR
jgi:hypothetical protein